MGLRGPELLIQLHKAFLNTFILVIQSAIPCLEMVRFFPKEVYGSGW
jgi:hypothetical protein